jgi:hypothetical protein
MSVTCFVSDMALILCKIEQEGSWQYETLENKFFFNKEVNQMQLTTQDVQLSSFLPAGTILEKEVNATLPSCYKFATSFTRNSTWDPPINPLDPPNRTNLSGDG